MLEKTVKDRVKRVLDAFKPDMDYFMPVQTGYGKRDLDFICTFRGHPFRIETKAPGKLLRPTQDNRIEELQAAGVDVWVIDDGTNFADHIDLKNWLEDIDMKTKYRRGKLYVSPNKRTA